MSDEEAKKESDKIDSDQQRVARTLGTSGWHIIENKLQDKILDLQSIRNIDTKEPDAVVADIKARNAAVEILVEWLNEIHGLTEQAKHNKENKPQKEYSHIKRDEG